MRIYLLIFFIAGIVFQSLAQTGNSVKEQDVASDRIVEGDKEVYGETIPDSLRVSYYCEVMPVFPGGDTAFNTFIKKNLLYPKDAKKNNITGIVYIQFVVEKDGSLSSIQIVPNRGLYPSCDKAAIDVISKSPWWTPGMNHGNPVRIKCVRRIKFSFN